MSIRNVALVALVALAMVALAGAHAWAGCGACGPKGETLAGTVKSLCTHSNTLVLTTGSGDEAKDVTLKVCPKGTKVTINGKAATLDDVKAGAAATVTHTHTKKGLLATAITVGGDLA